jgi:uridine kinase
MWPSVRRGEFKWIYPFIEDADIVFNSALHYEMGVLKAEIEALLTPIERTNPHFMTVNRLLKYLKYFIPIDPVNVPEDSILREFIGH